MNKVLGLALMLIGLSVTAQYKVEIDLTATENDQVPVKIYVPKSTSDMVEYHMAKIVPGTYSISDFGRFVIDFQALDADGNELDVEKLSINRWSIKDAQKLHMISYKVHDTFDPFEGYGEDKNTVIFEPGGTGFDKERGVFFMNTFGFVGYIKGQKFQPYEMTVIHPKTLYGGTALKRKSQTQTEDVFVADDFNFLADGPILYCEPDTVTKDLAGAEILVSVFSPNKVLSAREVMDNIDELMEAQAKYLGGELPVDRYAYLIYLMDDNSLSGALGALEHSYSSMYSLPEENAETIGQTVKDVAAHEFLHIVTPLNIHSEEIGEFDYINPKMSKHLWLYEGVTEYSSMHVQVKYGLYSAETFLEEITKKLRRAERYDASVSFTEMSEKILQEDYAEMYGNVYQKGALIGLCLDLYLLKYSNGEYDLQQLMRDLAKKYGKSVSFNDDELFDIITEMTFPEIDDFFKKYVAGSEPLPIAEVLNWAGIDYTDEIEVQELSFGGVALSLNENKEIYVRDDSRMNAFGKELGYQTGDIIKSVNKIDFNLSSVQSIVGEFDNMVEEGDKVIVEVLREKKGKLKKQKLKAKVFSVTRTLRHSLAFNPNPSDSQIELLKNWIIAD